MDDAKTLPPLPWDWVTSGSVAKNGMFHAYLVDATGRKIGVIWGKGSERPLIADHILKCVNKLAPAAVALARAADTAELLLHRDFPASAETLRTKVTALKELFDAKTDANR